MQREDEAHIMFSIDCNNVVVFADTEQIIYDLVCEGCIKGYMICTKHGVGNSASYAFGNPINTLSRDQIWMLRNQMWTNKSYYVECR